MKTTKEQRTKIRMENYMRISPSNKDLTILLDDLESLESRCKWAEEMLERAKDLIANDSEGRTPCRDWLADLEKGPQ